MNTRHIDVAVIGAGTAGLAAYRAAKAAGAAVVLIEGGEYGTTCARVGCMPSKLLIAAADAAHAAQRASSFGVHIDGQIRIDGHEVMNRVRRERDRFVEMTMFEIHEIPRSDKVKGRASFLGDHTLEVAGLRIEAKSIVIATGSRATYPDSFGAVGDHMIISDDVFNWRKLPNSVAVIGCGIIGLELGQALHRLGVRVAVLGRGGRVGPISDPSVRAYSIATFSDEFALKADAHIIEILGDTNGATVRRLGKDGATVSESFDYVLAATGRAPNVKGIGLDRTTLVLDANGVPLFDHSTTRTVSASGASPIFLAGDAGNYIPLLHEAACEGGIAGENAARLAQGKSVTQGWRRAPIAIVFTDPQIGIVGGGFHSMTPGKFAIGQASFENQGRSRILLRNKGLLNVYGDAHSGHFLGAEMIAPEAEHLAHLLSWALQNKMTVAQMLEMPFYHPVVEEGLRTALRDLERKLHAM